jgi:hypothetical protein
MAKHVARHHVDIIEKLKKPLIVFSHVEQPTKSKLILGRENEISAYSREESASLELNLLHVLW